MSNENPTRDSLRKTGTTLRPDTCDTCVRGLRQWDTCVDFIQAGLVGGGRAKTHQLTTQKHLQNLPKVTN